MATALGKGLTAFGISMTVFMVSDLSIAQDIMPLENEKSRGDLLLEQTRQEFEVSPPPQQEDYSLIAAFSFPGDVGWDRKSKKPRSNSHFGIDLSHWQGDGPDFSLLAAKGIEFAYFKASQGTRYRDDRFIGFWRSAEKNSVPRGAYHFLSQEDGAEQARFYLTTIKKVAAISSQNLVPAVDIEADHGPSGKDPDNWRGVSPEATLRILVDFCQEVERETGVKPLIYTAPLWWRGQLKQTNLPSELSEYHFWIADLGDRSLLYEKPRLPE